MLTWTVRAHACNKTHLVWCCPAPQGYYNVERMLKAVISKGGQGKICGTCAEGRGIQDLGLIEGVEISTMSQLAQWVMDSDKVLTF